MEKNLDPNEFSTSIDELLQEEDDITVPSTRKIKDNEIVYDSESEHENEPEKKPSSIKNKLKTTTSTDLPCFMKKTWMKEWFFTMNRDFVSKVLILSILFVLFTNPFCIKLLQEYLPFCFTTGSVGYNMIGSLILSCLFSIIYAFLAIE